MSSRDTNSVNDNILQKRKNQSQSQSQSQNLKSQWESTYKEFRKDVLLTWGVFIVIALVGENLMPPDSLAKFFFVVLGNIIFFIAVYRTYQLRKMRKSKPADPAPLRLDPIGYGFFFGRASDQDIGKPIDKDGHILVMGGAGSGKSACIAIPTLKYHWNQRFIAIDIKGELAEKSQRRALIFNPLNPSTYGYDPFYLSQKALKTAQDPTPYVRDIALAIVPLPPSIKEPFFIQSAQSLLTGHLLANLRQGFSFVDSIEVLQSVPVEEIIETDIKDEWARKHLIQLTAYIGTHDKTLGSIISTLSNHIIPFATDPDIKTALSKPNIITPELLETGNNIFIQIPEYKIDQWKVLINLILQQFLTHFEKRTEGNQTPILFLLDEFARFGKLEKVIHGLATLRSKKITICLIIQSFAQLDAIYGQDQRKVIADNCAYKAILSASDPDTQKSFSNLVGTEERKQQSYTIGSNSSSTTTSVIEKPIIRPEEFGYLRDIVLITPKGFGRVEKAPYYREMASKGVSLPSRMPPHWL